MIQTIVLTPLLTESGAVPTLRHPMEEIALRHAQGMPWAKHLMLSRTHITDSARNGVKVSIFFFVSFVNALSLDRSDRDTERNRSRLRARCTSRDRRRSSLPPPRTAAKDLGELRVPVGRRRAVMMAIVEAEQLAQPFVNDHLDLLVVETSFFSTLTQ